MIEHVKGRLAAYNASVVSETDQLWSHIDRNFPTAGNSIDFYSLNKFIVLRLYAPDGDNEYEIHSDEAITLIRNGIDVLDRWLGSGMNVELDSLVWLGDDTPVGVEFPKSKLKSISGDLLPWFQNSYIFPRCLTWCAEFKPYGFLSCGFRND